MMICPCCQQPINPSRASRQQFNSAVAAPWAANGQWADAPASAPASAAFDAERRAPARPASLESDVFVPVLQSLATGAALLAPGITATLWLGWPWWAPLAISGGGSAISWLYLLNAHRQLLWIVEIISRQDIDGDGRIGQPPEQAEQEITLHIRHEDETGRAPHQQRLPLPKGVSEAMLSEFAASYQARGLSQSAWTGRGNLFSRAQYEQLMGVLQQAGIIEWVDSRNRSQGRRVTRGGRAALRFLAQEYYEN